MDPSTPIEWIVVLLYPTAAVLLCVAVALRGPLGSRDGSERCPRCGSLLQQDPERCCRGD